MSLQAFVSVSTLDYLVGIGVTLAVVTSLYKTRQVALASKNGVPLPPGPPARWFWESAMPTTRIARTLTDWVTTYGPLVTLREGSRITIIVGRVDATAEIMEKEGHALVDRPRWVAAGEMLSKGMRFVLLPDGERFRRFRKAAHAHLQPRAVSAYQEIQLENARGIVLDVLDDPKGHVKHAQRFAASVILRLTYGKTTPTSNDDPEVVRIHQNLGNLKSALRPGAYFVDRFPWLKYVPGYGRKLREHHNMEIGLFREQVGRVRLEMETNCGGNSFARMLLENTNKHQLSQDEIAYLAGNLFGAGADTTVVAITNMIMAAACNQEAQKQIHEELDLVVGKDRVPSWKDYESLPLVRAFVLESLRWRPVVPVGFAHRATRDIIWRDQCIPAGATVIGCHWAISRDPTVFPEPERFGLHRWIDSNGELRNTMSSYPYGYGRRVCPGLHLANKSLFISLACLLWSFHIAERPDAPIDTYGHADTVVAQAAPFDVEFIPRIEESRLRAMMSE